MSTSTAFLTDKYELTMLAAALADGSADKKVVFEAFARKLPQGRRYGVVAGTQRVIDAIKNFRFTDKQIAYLRAEGTLSTEAIDYLADFRFSGKVTGYREGELFFPDSPVLTVEGTFAECVILETVILSILNHDSAVAAAASRMVYAAKGKAVQELGSRRTHEEAAVSAARAAYLTGFSGTSNLEAGIEYGIPVFGTSAHAFTLLHEDEKSAFSAQVAALGKNTTLLVDTYDIPQGIKNAVEVAGTNLGAIRIDSGILKDETTKARALLDSLGAVNTKIVVSSDLDEYSIEELIETDAPVDAFGAGTRVVTGSGHPTASMVYKLVAAEDASGQMTPRAKSAAGKSSVGGRKSAWRRLDSAGYALSEKIVVRHGDNSDYTSDSDARALQVVFMENGEQVFEMTLDEIRAHHQSALAELRPSDKGINSGTAAVSAN